MGSAQATLIDRKENGAAAIQPVVPRFCQKLSNFQTVSPRLHQKGRRSHPSTCRAATRNVCPPFNASGTHVHEQARQAILRRTAARTTDCRVCRVVDVAVRQIVLGLMNRLGSLFYIPRLCRSMCGVCSATPHAAPGFLRLRRRSCRSVPIHFCKSSRTRQSRKGTRGGRDAGTVGGRDARKVRKTRD